MIKDNNYDKQEALALLRMVRRKERKLEYAFKQKEKGIYECATKLSFEANKTISVIIMDNQELNKEKEGQFLQSVKEAKEVLYGKNPS